MKRGWFYALFARGKGDMRDKRLPSTSSVVISPSLYITSHFGSLLPTASMHFRGPKNQSSRCPSVFFNSRARNVATHES